MRSSALTSRTAGSTPVRVLPLRPPARHLRRRAPPQCQCAGWGGPPARSPERGWPEFPPSLPACSAALYRSRSMPPTIQNTVGTSQAAPNRPKSSLAVAGSISCTRSGPKCRSRAANTFRVAASSLRVSGYSSRRRKWAASARPRRRPPPPGCAGSHRQLGMGVDVLVGPLQLGEQAVVRFGLGAVRAGVRRGICGHDRLLSAGFLEGGSGRSHAPTSGRLRPGQRQDLLGEAQRRLRRKCIGVLDERQELQHMGPGACLWLSEPAAHSRHTFASSPRAYVAAMSGVA